VLHPQSLRLPSAGGSPTTGVVLGPNSGADAAAAAAGAGAAADAELAAGGAASYLWPQGEVNGGVCSVQVRVDIAGWALVCVDIAG
jgi:hypothetical protein